MRVLSLACALPACLRLRLACLAARGPGGAAAEQRLLWPLVRRLSHLASYQGMGTARVECVSGCKCDPSWLDGTWDRQASLFTILRFHVRPGAGFSAERSCCIRSVRSSCPLAPLPSANACRASFLLQVTRHKQCRFRVTVLDKPGEFPQDGHKVRPMRLAWHLHAWPPRNA